MKYQLNRRVAHSVNVVGRISSGTIVPISALLETSSEPDSKGFYTTTIPDSIADAIQGNSDLVAKLAKKETLPILFRFGDTISDNKIFAEYELQAYAVDQRGLQEVIEILNSSNQDKLEKPDAMALAKKILGKEVTAPDSEITAVDGFNALFEMLLQKPDKGRNKWLKVLSTVGTIGLNYIGLPVKLK